MESDEFSGDLRKFLQKAFEVQASEPKERLTEDRLREIAARAGISEEDWQELCEALSEHLQKGRNYLKFSNYPDSIIELDSAVVIAPYRTDVLIDCGEAHFQHWKRTGSRQSRERARSLFEKSLRIDPGNASAADRLSNLRQSEERKKRNARKGVFVALATLVLSGGAWIALSDSSSAAAYPKPETTPRFISDPSESDDTGSRSILTNSLGMQFVPVPGTSVLFGIHTTRMKDYATFAAANPGIDSSWRSQTFYNHPVSVGDSYPVVGVNWYESAAFCEWLSEKEGRVYRLPTDREWSIAAGLGELEYASGEVSPLILNKDTAVWPWGAEWPPPDGTGNFADSVAKTQIATLVQIPGYTDGYGTTAPVMSFKPNRFGLFDMGGNVQQWCQDWYSPDNLDRVERGGHYGLGGSDGKALSATRRDHHPPQVRTPYTGFRVVLEASSD